MAERLEQLPGALDRGRRLCGATGKPSAETRAERHSESARVGTHLLGERADPAPVRSTTRTGSGGPITSSTAAVSATVRVRTPSVAIPIHSGSGRGAPAPARLEADQPAARGRDPNRTAAVAALGDREHARRHRGGRATARATRGVLGVPGIAGHAVAEVLGDGDRAELGGVGPAGENEAGFDQAVGDDLALARRLCRTRPFEPRVSGCPATGRRSLIGRGTPAKGASAVRARSDPVGDRARAAPSPRRRCAR